MAKVTPLSATQVKQALTNNKVKAATENGKVFKMRDGEGLHLRIRPNGSRTWVLEYVQPYTKKRTSLSFGTYPEISLAQAREEKTKVRELLSQNVDPKVQREEIIRDKKLAITNTLESVYLSWFELKKIKIKASTAKGISEKFIKYVIPALGHRPINKISAPEVIEILKPIAAKGTLETNVKIMRYLNEVMTFAVNTGVIANNPLINIKAAFQAPKTKHMPTLKPKELPELMKALASSSAKLITRYLIEWQLHTMVRPGEAAQARWTEIDFKNKCWVIPAETMKKDRDHTVPLSDHTLSLLMQLQPYSGHREFIFPGDRNPNTHASVASANNALKRMGFRNRLVAHGMRSIASTTLNEQGFDPDVIETALSHIDQNEVRRAYNRSDYLERRRVMMAWWSEHIESAAKGNFSLSADTKMLRAV